MRRTTFAIALAAALVLGTVGQVSGQPRDCLDNPYYYCFSKCDTFWRWCVNGSHGCWIIWEFDTCVNDYNMWQCCTIARPGLF